ncbi:hypothetical protein DB29_01596 [Shouchella clausii]|nr:hypothetical protein DB29_01596 [Shouchella clausii]
MLELQNTSVECQGVAVRFEKEKRWWQNIEFSTRFMYPFLNE